MNETNHGLRLRRRVTPASVLRPVAAAVLMAAPGTGAEGGGSTCSDTPLRTQVEQLQAAYADRPGRFILTLRSADDATRSDVAQALRDAGAYSAEPLGRQPLLVVEMPASVLGDLAADPRILCVQQDSPDPPAR